MGQQINVNIRMDSDIKKQADILFHDFGFNLSTAINAFIRQSLKERAIPFQIRTVNPAQTKDVLLARGREVFHEIQKDSVRNGTNKMTMEEIDAEIAACRREKKAGKV